MTSMKLNPQDLKKIAHLTLEHYNQRAEDFWEGTRGHNVSQNIAALLQYIESEPRFMTRFWLRARARPQVVCRPRSHRGRFGRRRALRRDGARPQRLRSMAAGFPR